MAVGVVDGLEAVEVHVADAQPVLAAPRLGQAVAQQFLEEPAVGQAGQRIMQGHVLRPLLAVLELVDVDDHPDRLAGAQRRAAEVGPDVAAVVLAQLQLGAEAPAALQRFIAQLADHLEGRLVGIDHAGGRADDGLVAEDAADGAIGPDDLAVLHADHADEVVVQQQGLLARQARGVDAHRKLPPVLQEDVDETAGHQRNHGGRDEPLTPPVGLPARKVGLGAQAGDHDQRIARHAAVGGHALHTIERRIDDVGPAVGVERQLVRHLRRHVPLAQAVRGVGLGNRVARHQAQAVRTQRDGAVAAQRKT